MTMSGMFTGASAFRGAGVGGWDVTAVAYMRFMFMNCTKFDADLSGWQVGRCVNMDRMFSGASAFRGVGVGGWDVGNCNDFMMMFYNTEAFDQNLSGWKVERGYDLTSGMFMHVEGRGAFDRRHAPWATPKAFGE